MNAPRYQKRCIIITAYNPDGLPHIARQSDDCVVCADGGYLSAKKGAIRPDLIIGDFDSDSDSDTGSPCIRPEEDPFFAGVPVIAVPVEKDDTDTMLCVKHGLELGFTDFLIVGGIGGRLDHTIANIQVLAYLKDHGADAVLSAPGNRALLADPGSVTLTREPGYKFSLFAFTDRCCGVTLHGAKYPLNDATLESSFPLGVSNEFAEETVTVSFTEGRLLVIMSSGG